MSDLEFVYSYIYSFKICHKMDRNSCPCWSDLINWNSFDYYNSLLDFYIFLAWFHIYCNLSSNIAWAQRFVVFMAFWADCSFDNLLTKKSSWLYHLHFHLRFCSRPDQTVSGRYPINSFQLRQQGSNLAKKAVWLEIEPLGQDPGFLQIYCSLLYCLFSVILDSYFGNHTSSKSSTQVNKLL